MGTYQVNKDDLDQYIQQLHKSTKVPKDNITTYLHIYNRIKEAREDSEDRIDKYIALNKSFQNVLKKSIESSWLSKAEGGLIAQIWRGTLNKKTNVFSMKALGAYLASGSMLYAKTRKGRRFNPALEFLLYALRSDAKEFGNSPKHGDISEFLSFLEGKGRDLDTYNEPYIRGKRTNNVLVNNILLFCRRYYQAIGEEFLPKNLPADPRGYLRGILLDMGMIKTEPLPKFTLPIPRKP